MDILAKIKSDPSLSEYGKHVLTIRRMQKDDLLIQVKEACANVPNFMSAIEAMLKKMASVRTGAHRVAVSCSGMNEAVYYLNSRASW